MESITLFIENVLKLKVNRNKSAVDKPSKRKFLGFSFYIKEEKVRNFIHKKPVKRFREKVKKITSRSNGKSVKWTEAKAQPVNNRLGYLLSYCRHEKCCKRT